MGRKFYEHMGGSVVYHCIKCEMWLTNTESLVSKNFNGLTGESWLFDKVGATLLVLALTSSV